MKFSLGPGLDPVLDELLAEVKRLRDANEPFHHAMRKVARHHLHNYATSREGLSKKVFISTGDCCEACNRDKNRIMTIEEALAEDPIPHADCTRYRHVQVEGACWCRFLAVTEDHPPREDRR